MKANRKQTRMEPQANKIGTNRKQTGDVLFRHIYTAVLNHCYFYIKWDHEMSQKEYHSDIPQYSVSRRIYTNRVRTKIFDGLWNAQGLKPFERTIDQTTETMFLVPKQ